MSSPALKSLLSDLRQHPAFAELLDLIRPEPIPRFKRTQSAEVEKARADWIYYSGKRDQYDQTYTHLTGAEPSQNKE